MKINKVFCIIFITLIVCSGKALAVNNIVKDNFDSMPPEYQITAKGEASVGIKNEDDGNSVLELKGYGKNSALAERTVSIDNSGKTYMDLDFKRETNNGTLFRIQAWDSAKSKRPLIFYITSDNITACGQNIPVSSYGSNVWLKLRTVIDFENRKFDFYINNNLVCSGRNFNQDAEDIGFIQFQVDANNSSEEYTYCYIDNLNIFKMNNQILDEFISSKKTELEDNYYVGTDINQYSPTKYAMAVNRLSEIEKIAENDLSDDEQAEYINEIQSCIDMLDNGRFCNSSDSGTVERIPNDIRSCMDAKYSTSGESDIIISLKAETYDNFNELCGDSTYSWQILDCDSDDVTLDADRLIVKPGTQCTVVVRAVSADMYRDIEIFLHDNNSVAIKNITAKKGVVTVNGSLKLVVDDNVYIKIKGVTVDKSEIITADENGEFTVNFKIDEETDTQDIVISAEGEYLTPIEMHDVYIGKDIEDVVLPFINSSDSDVLSKNINKYISAFDIDRETYENYQSDFIKKIADGQPYESLNDINIKLSYMNFEILFGEGDRENIENLIEVNKDILKENGFNYDKYEALRRDNKNLFLVEILKIKSDDINGICKEMNYILSKYDDTNQENHSSGGKHSSGGSGGGGGNYSVIPQPTPETDNTPSDTDSDDKTPLKPFEDINECEWARDAILYMQSEGILSGYGDNRILPNNVLTRAEFAKILVTAFSIGEEIPYEKQPDDKWWSIYVNKGVLSGIIKGDENGNFHPDDMITREDMAVLIYRTVLNKKIDLYVKEPTKDFYDHDEISDYASDAVKALQESGIVKGIGENMFAPHDKVTRAQAILAVYNAMHMREVS